MTKPRLQTTTLTVRIEPDTKGALAAVAHAERCSLASMLEVVVLQWCRDRGIPTQPPKTNKTK